MPFSGIHHVVIRVHDLDQATAHWSESFGMTVSRTAENAALGVRQAFFDLEDGTFVELVAPLSADAPVAKALEARGEGVHLISMSVGGVDSAVSEMQTKGVTIIGGSSGPRFVHPKSASGVMLGMFETSPSDEAAR